MLRDFSSLGASGAHGHNVLRDFQRAVNKRTHMPELYQATVPLWDKHATKSVSGYLYFLLPHELLPLLVKDSLHAWTVFDDSIRELQPVVNQWRATNIPGDDRDGLVAMSVWGDSAPFNTRDSLALFCGAPLLATTKTDSGLLFARSHLCVVVVVMAGTRLTQFGRCWRGLSGVF